MITTKTQASMIFLGLLVPNIFFLYTLMRLLILINRDPIIPPEIPIITAASKLSIYSSSLIAASLTLPELISLIGSKWPVSI